MAQESNMVDISEKYSIFFRTTAAEYFFLFFSLDFNKKVFMNLHVFLALLKTVAASTLEEIKEVFGKKKRISPC
jgi:hypothetical protein